MAGATTGPERFLVRGRLQAMPRRLEDRRLVLGWLAAQVVDHDARVTERELTDRLATLVDDPVARRRDLVEAGLLTRTRDGSEYWRTAVEAHAAPEPRSPAG